MSARAEWQGTLEDVEVLERDDQKRALLVETESDATVKKVRSTLRFSYDPPDGLSWEQEKGEMKWLTGQWVLEELDAEPHPGDLLPACRPRPDARPAAARPRGGQGEGDAHQERGGGAEGARREVSGRRESNSSPRPWKGRSAAFTPRPRERPSLGEAAPLAGVGGIIAACVRGRQAG